MRLLNHATEVTMPSTPILKPASLFVYVVAMILTATVVFMGQPAPEQMSLMSQLVGVGWRVFILLFVMGAGAIIWAF
jgi:hypothetical protein